jgi:hypothetical protein
MTFSGTVPWHYLFDLRFLIQILVILTAADSRVIQTVIVHDTLIWERQLALQNTYTVHNNVMEPSSSTIISALF